jgi:hypothetical protein
MSFTLKLALFAACLVTAEAMAINIGTAEMPSFRPDGTPCCFIDCLAPAGGYGQSTQGGQRVRLPRFGLDTFCNPLVYTFAGDSASAFNSVTYIERGLASPIKFG